MLWGPCCSRALFNTMRLLIHGVVASERRIQATFNGDESAQGHLGIMEYRGFELPGDGLKCSGGHLKSSLFHSLILVFGSGDEHHVVDAAQSSVCFGNDL
jgi:hypothetical protein